MTCRRPGQPAWAWPLHLGLIALAALNGCAELAAWRQPPPGWHQPAPTPQPSPAPSPQPSPLEPHGGSQPPTTQAPGPGLTPGPGGGLDQHPWLIVEPAVGALAPLLPPPWDIIAVGVTGIIGGVLYGRRRRQAPAGGAQ